MTRSALQRLIHRNPTIVVGVFVLTMGAALLGMIAWKAAVAHQTTLGRAEKDIQNLAHSLTEHAANAFKAPDVAGAFFFCLHNAPKKPERLNYLAGRLGIGNLLCSHGCKPAEEKQEKSELGHRGI